MSHYLNMLLSGISGEFSIGNWIFLNYVKCDSLLIHSIQNGATRFKCIPRILLRHIIIKILNLIYSYIFQLPFSKHFLNIAFICPCIYFNSSIFYMRPTIYI